MTVLGRFRILVKILSIVLMMSAIAGGLSWLGIHSMSVMDEAAVKMEAAANRALESARANQNVIAFNRAEYRIAMDPRPENREAANKVLDGEMKTFLERLEDIKKTPDPQAKAMLPAVDAALADYRKSLANTLGIADTLKDAEIGEQGARLRAAVVQSRAFAEKLHASIRAISVRLSERVDGLAKQAEEEYRWASRLLTIAAIAGVLLGVLAGYLIGQFGIVKPIGELVRDADRLAAGDTTVKFDTASRGDEIGVISAAVAKFRDNVIAQQKAAESFASEVKAREEFNRNMEEAVEHFRNSSSTLIGSVSDNATAMKQAAEDMSGIAGDASRQALSASEASDQTANNVQTVAAAAEQLASSIQEIGRQIELATSTVNSAGALTARSEAEIEGLANAAQRIGSVVDLIQAIAAQTNLLALNATIEAARAGDAGRGFAIVAQEVKSLAAQTAKATDEISKHIGEIQTTTGNAVTSVKEISEAMHNISEVTTAIAGAVEQQGAATREISQNVQMAANGTQTLASSISTVTAAIDQTSRTSGEVLGTSGKVFAAAEDLAEQVKDFFVKLRRGPLDRRKEDDPNYRGPERRDVSQREGHVAVRKSA